MEQLITKYRLGTLTPEELAQLREMAEAASDTELAEILTATPINDPVDPDDIPASQLRRIKSVIDRATDAPVPWWRRTVTIAAAVIALPLISSLITFMLLPPSIESSPASPATISTRAAGDHITEVMLPDGTSVFLGEKSSVEMLTYGRDSRTVKFHGHAYFNVAKIPCHDHDGNIPFRIIAPGMDVEVTGTSFSIVALDSAATSILSLDSGSVSLMADQTMNKVKLSPGQRAVLDRTTGVFEINSNHNSNEMSDWMRRELSFDHADAAEIASTLNANYGVQLDQAVISAIDSPFSGTLPANDLATALTILSRIYSFKLPYNTAVR
ncbi:MAG: FecR domain-containing protein [Muribaculaceae bacterium]|nr:FecR domain-containing protein [Muribaculaceae bacterium]